MDKIQVNRVLPQELVIFGAESHLYRIGLSLYKTGSVKRKWFYNPILVFIITTQLLIRNIVFLLLPEMSEEFYLYLGDAGYFIGYRILSEITAVLITLISVLSQIINYMNYKNGIKPIDLKVFSMVSNGLITPQSIGLNDKQMVYKLIKVIKTTLLLSQIVLKSVPCVVFIIVMSLFVKLPLKLFFIAVPNTGFVWAISCHYIYSIIIYQFVYYFLITYYLKSKILLINTKLKSIIEKRSICNKNVMKFIRELNAIYYEINEYNSNYWSKFLLIIWFTISSIIALLTFVVLFSEQNIIFKIFLSFFALIFTSILIFIINISSDVYNEANNSYILFNSLMKTIPQKSYSRFKVSFHSFMKIYL